MADEMIERVAKALYAHATGNTDDWYMTNPTPWHKAARAAIEAMRQCTDEMNDAGSDQCDGGEAEESCRCGFMGKIWTAMIDAALKPE